MKIGELLNDPQPLSFKRDRPDDPVRVLLAVELRDGRTVEVEVPKGARPKVDMSVDSGPGPMSVFGEARPIRTVERSARIVIDVKERDGVAEDGSMFRLTVREPVAVPDGG